ncbi:hypothetical protein KUTeg_008087 [Tegillarca granosa]|uniref:Cytidyltransferase-like domain-containing protein n=1 Tax=Tegillarca granosa TaxID=220873 RepID=A0ABQ9FBA4_TEGGR|nr:hypothetical protein KUTeg_008087 [Tegillarca granosa]
MYQTGLLVLTRPFANLRQNIPSMLQQVEKLVENTLYIHIQPTTQTSTSKPHDIFKLRHVSCSTDFRSVMREFYSTSASICTHLDVRILLGHVTKHQNNELWETGYNLKKSCDIVLFDDEKYVSKDKNLQNQLADYLVQNFKMKSIPNFDILKESAQDNLLHDVDSTQGEMLNLYDYVCLGGTFDRLHVGHKMMLGEACLLCKSCLTCGVTEQNMNKKKTLLELIQPIDERISVVVNFIEDVKPTIKHKVVPISDMFGPTITDPDLQCIVLSPETQKGGGIINQEREKKGMQKLDEYVIEIVEDICHNEYEEMKVSSSSLRKRILGTLIKPVVQKDDIPSVPYLIGVTGSVCSGKSSICKRLEGLGATLVNCDLLGHKVYVKGMLAYDKLIEEFGREIIGEDGEINRKALGEIVFSNPEKLNFLNNTVWPEIRRLAKEEIIQHKSEGKKVIVLEAALLLEAGWDDLVHEVWTAIIPRDEAIKRMIDRNRFSETEAAKRVDSQMSNEERWQKSNVVLCSLWEYEYTQQQVEKAWQLLQKRCSL